MKAFVDGLASCRRFPEIPATLERIQSVASGAMPATPVIAVVVVPVAVGVFH